MKKLAVVLVAFLVGCGGCGGGEVDFHYPEKTDIKTDGQLYESEEISLPSELWGTPKSERCPELDRGKVKGYYLTSVQGTEIFAYVGLPEGASEENRVPGVVLIHGGGGTAFSEWVEIWNKRGYAAVAMCYDGNIPTLQSGMNNTINAPADRPHGPVFNTFSDGELPVEEQWAFHALASVVVSHSFLRSFPEVDETKVGVTGISRGGFLCCLAVGFDDRFAFAAPVYGALGIEETSYPYGSAFSRNPRSDALWNTLDILRASRTPTLFVCGSNDAYIPVAAVSRSVSASQNGSVLIIQDYPHSHSHGSSVEEIYIFADGICREKSVNPHLSEQPDAQNTEFEIDLPKGVSLVSATAYYTSNDEINALTVWFDEEQSVKGNRVIWSLPESASHCYLTMTDSRGLCVSTLLISYLE